MSVDETIVKLLSQADGTRNAEEAAAYAGKAQALATKYGIDIERARQAQADRGKREIPTMRVITVGRKTAKGRGAAGNKYFVMLFSKIADSNDVKIDISHRSDAVYAYGFPSDIDVCEALFNFIAAQMVEACAKDILEGRNREAGVNARDYKGNFYEAYRSVISKRLQEARERAIVDSDEAGREIMRRLQGEEAAKPEPVPAAPGAELVLARKADEVRDYYRKTSTARGSYGYHGHEVGNYSSGARTRGTEAGAQARISAAKQIGGIRTQLPR